MSIPAGRINFSSWAWDAMQEVSFAHEKNNNKSEYLKKKK